MSERPEIFRSDLMAGMHAFLAGATSGINLEIAERMAGLGANVFVISRDPAKVAAAVEKIGHGARGVSADVRNYDQVAAAVKQSVDAFGPIDTLVSGAAGNFLAAAKDISPNGFKTVIDIDLMGSFHVARAGYEHLRKPGSSVLFISALQSFRASPAQAHAAAAKAGIDAMMRNLAVEWGRDGIRVNSILPGAIADTEGMLRLAPDEEAVRRATAAVPLGRWGKKADVADLAVFLSSAGADNINGAMVVTDGGTSL